jgi:hypothetical protein
MDRAWNALMAPTLLVDGDDYGDDDGDDDFRDSANARLLECCDAWARHVAVPMPLVGVTVGSLAAAYLRVDDDVDGDGRGRRPRREKARAAAHQYLVTIFESASPSLTPDDVLAASLGGGGGGAQAAGGRGGGGGGQEYQHQEEAGEGQEAPGGKAGKGRDDGAGWRPGRGGGGARREEERRLRRGGGGVRRLPRGRFDGVRRRRLGPASRGDVVLPARLDPWDVRRGGLGGRVRSASPPLPRTAGERRLRWGDRSGMAFVAFFRHSHGRPAHVCVSSRD